MNIPLMAWEKNFPADGLVGVMINGLQHRLHLPPPHLQWFEQEITASVRLAIAVLTANRAGSVIVDSPYPSISDVSVFESIPDKTLNVRGSMLGEFANASTKSEEDDDDDDVDPIFCVNAQTKNTTTRKRERER
jgi:hypothetical protein